LNRKLVSFVLLGALVSIGYCLLLSFAHPFVLASPEARASVEVTESQRTELLSAKFASEIIGFSVFGLLLGAVIAIVSSHPSSVKHRAMTLLVGSLLGALGGALMGWIGYVFHDSLIAILPDPMVHVFVRLSAMLLPVAMAVGLTTALGCSSKAVILNAFMGSVIGAMLSALVYGILAGVVTPLENVANIFPAHMQNRYLLFVTAFLAIGAVDLIQAARTPSGKSG
jgi:hypothetical protein